MSNERKEPNPEFALMIDTETLSLRPDATVVQVGLCLANVRTRNFWVRPRRYHIIDHEHGHMDPGTIGWWMLQSEAARTLVFDRRAPTFQAATMEQVFDNITSLVKDYSPTVWASPAMFDLPVLTSMWGGRKPWDYRAERDMGTLKRVLDPNGELMPELGPLDGEDPIEHDAMYDAHYQMHYLFNLLDKLRGMGVDC